MKRRIYSFLGPILITGLLFPSGQQTLRRVASPLLSFLRPYAQFAQDVGAGTNSIKIVEKILSGQYSRNNPPGQPYQGLVDFNDPQLVELLSKQGALVFDIDQTLLYKLDKLKKKVGEDQTPQFEDRQVQFAVALLTRILEKGIPVALISGNDVNVQYERFVKKVVDAMKGNSNLENLYYYANGGATKVIFDQNGNMQSQPNYDKSFSLTGGYLAKVKNFVEEYVKKEESLLSAYVAEIQKRNSSVSEQQIKDALKQAFQKEGNVTNKQLDSNSKVTFNTDWIDNPSKFSLTVISADLLKLAKGMYRVDIDNNGVVWVGKPGSPNSVPLKNIIDQLNRLENQLKNGQIEQEEYNKKRGEILSQIANHKVTEIDGFWLEVRTGLGDRGNRIAVQMTIKRLPSEVIANLGKSVRNRVIDAMEIRKLQNISAQRKVAFRPGGTTSIDIGTDKSEPVEDFIQSLNNAGRSINNSAVLYFGDEITYRGNDIPVIKVDDVKIYTSGGQFDEGAIKAQLKDYNVPQNEYNAYIERIKAIGNTPIETWLAIELILRNLSQPQQGGGDSSAFYLPDENYNELSLSLV